jgi:hypothetical protein
VPQLASTTKFVPLHQALVEEPGAADLPSEQLTAKVITAIRHCRLARKFIVAYLIVPEDSQRDIIIRRVGEVSDLSIDLWNQIRDRIELQCSWIFWHAPPTVEGEAWVERGLIVLVDAHGVRRVVRRLLTAARSPAKQEGPGRLTVFTDEEADEMVQRFVARRPEITRSRLIALITASMAERGRFPSETTVGTNVRASLKRQGISLRPHAALKNN